MEIKKKIHFKYILMQNIFTQFLASFDINFMFKRLIFELRGYSLHFNNDNLIGLAVYKSLNLE